MTRADDVLQGASVCSSLAPTTWGHKDRCVDAEELRQIFHEIQRVGDEDALPHPLEDITDLELEEIRQLKHPPNAVRRVMECVHLILYETEPPGQSGLTWAVVVRSVVKTDFLRQVRRYEIERLLEKPAMVDYICREYFGPGSEQLRLDRVRRGSVAVVAFFGWTVALIAGVLPVWPAYEDVDDGSEEVAAGGPGRMGAGRPPQRPSEHAWIAGDEARAYVAELEAERQRQVRQDMVRKEEQRQREQRAEEERKLAKERERLRREEEQKEAERLEQMERERVAMEAEAKKEEARQQELARSEAEKEAVAARQRELERQRAAQKERERKKYLDWCLWNVHNNPDRRFLQVEGNTVTFVRDDLANYCNVVTQTALTQGVVFFEFLMHRVGDEQWVGVTTDEAQAGVRISGRNLLQSWTYYCGRRWNSPAAFKDSGVPGLQVDKRFTKSFARVVSGDIIGMVVDADRRGLAFLRNSELQGACALDAAAKPLFVITHLDAAGDSVELRAQPGPLAPQVALDAITAVCKFSSNGLVTG